MRLSIRCLFVGAVPSRHLSSSWTTRMALGTFSGGCIASGILLAESNNNNNNNKKTTDTTSSPIHIDISAAVYGHVPSSIGWRFLARALDAVFIAVGYGVLQLLTGHFAAMCVGAAADLLKDVVWGERSLGKRLLHLQVLDAESGRLATRKQRVARNVFAPYFLSLMASMGSGVFGVVFLVQLASDLTAFFTEDTQTLTDIMAGTVVVNEPRNSY